MFTKTKRLEWPEVLACLVGEYLEGLLADHAETTMSSQISTKSHTLLVYLRFVLPLALLKLELLETLLWPVDARTKRPR